MQWLPTPVVAETNYGVATARSNTTEQEVRTRLLGYPRLDIDEEIARTAGELLSIAGVASDGLAAAVRGPGLRELSPTTTPNQE